MYACPPDCLCLLHPCCIGAWKYVHPCVVPCVCPSHTLSGPTSWPEVVHIYQYMYASTPTSTGLPDPLWIFALNVCTPLWLHVCVLAIHHLVSNPWPEDVNVSVHVYMSTSPSRSNLPLHIVKHIHVHPYVHVPAILHLISNFGQRVHMHQYMYACLLHSPGSGPMYIGNHKKIIYTCRSHKNSKENSAHCDL